MKCHPEIAEILARILQSGLLQARAAGWSGNATRAAIEADHVHNLPILISDYSIERLRYYWDAERPVYLAQVGPDGAESFQALWDELRLHVEPNLPSAVAG
jgi:hypothetical protein